MHTVTVVHLIAGTVVEAEHVGERIIVQHSADGLALIKVYRDGRVIEGISYRNAEVVVRKTP
jgi:hypothetical protein